MLIFLDTEFTDFIDRELVSIGMVSEDGQYEFYAERTDYNDSWCNHFVHETVLPLLGQSPGSACTRHELTKRLWAWFATLPRHVRIASDSTHDRDLLWDAFGEGLPKNLDKTVLDLRSLIDTTVFNDAVCRYHGKPGQPWHHALHDARAHRIGWMAWMAKRKTEKHCQQTGVQGFIEDEYAAQKQKNRLQFDDLIKRGLAKATDASVFHGLGRECIVIRWPDEEF